MQFIKRCDIFPKYADPDVKVKTISGAIMSIFTVLMMCLLFFHEFYRFVKPRIFDEIVVDTSRIGLHRTMPINFNLTIAMPCNKLNIDAYDFEGNQQIEKTSSIKSHRIDENGYAIDDKTWLSLKKKEVQGREKKYLKKREESNYCGSCYGAGARGQCCNSCDDVIDAFKAKGWGLTGIDRWAQCVEEGYASLGKETCNIDGIIRVSRVSGEFHISLSTVTRLGGKQEVDISKFSRATNLSHTIHYLEFGPKIPGIQQPLDDTHVIQDEPGKMVYQYHLEVVPTKWISRREFEVNTFKFSPMISRRNLTEKTSKVVPGIYFSYNMAPYSVVSVENAYTFWHFITSVCAIVGGAFTCASLADQFFFKALSTIEGKKKIGKDI